MGRMQRRLTYANVMSSIAVFLVLGSGAYAIGRLPRHSVGPKQLKAGAVTAAKLHKNAVTSAKIREGAVDGSKVYDGSLTGNDIDPATTPFGRVVARLRGTTSLGVTEVFQAFPLNPSTYSQAGEEVDSYVGAVDIAFQSSCAAPRNATAIISLDAAGPAKEEEKVVGFGQVGDSGAGAVARRIEIGPYMFLGPRFEPGTATTHTVSLLVKGKCEGGGSGIAASFGGVDVIGTR